MHMKVWLLDIDVDLDVECIGIHIDKIIDSNGTNLVLPSRTRQDPTYIFWYTVSMIWHPTITTAIIPFVALSYMNFHIFKGLKQSAKVL